MRLLLDSHALDVDALDALCHEEEGIEAHAIEDLVEQFRLVVDRRFNAELRG